MTLGIVLCTAQLSCHRPAREADSGGMLQDLARAGIARRIQPLLSISVEHRECVSWTAPDESIPRTECRGRSEEPSRGAIEVAERASAAAQATGDPEAVHAAALIDLLWVKDGGMSLQESITSLQRVARLADHPGSALTDLAAALLVRAERTQNARDLLEAVEAADSAVGLEPDNRAARFNLALALDRLGLDDQASAAWKEFLMLDSKSGWAAEASNRVHEIAVTPIFPILLPADASLGNAAEYAARAPQEARDLGWDRLLGEWGAAALQADSARAESRLRLADALGRALELEGADGTLADAVRAIRARASDPKATRRLAQAHLQFAAGRRAFTDVDYEAAATQFAAVLQDRPASSALVDWVLMYRSATLVYEGRLADAERILQSLSARVDTVRHPALAGRVSGALATTLLRDGRLEGALHASRLAVRMLERADERELLGGALYLVADIAFALGTPLEAYTSIHQASMRLRPYRGSVWLCNLLSVAGRTAASDGFLRASLRFQNERVAVAERNGHALYRAEARLARAQVLSAAGDDAAAAVDVESGQALVPGIKPRFLRTWMEVDLRLARAASLLRTRPDRATAALDSVLDQTNRTLIPIRLLRALIGRAEAHLALGNHQGATADLDRATAVLSRQHDAIARAPLRASLLDAGRALFDRLVMLRIAEGDTVGALAYLERGRTSFTHPWTGAGTATEVREWKPRNGVAVEYALIGDTLLIWTVVGNGARLARSTVDGARLERTVERVRSLLELRADENAVRPALAELYDRMIRPAGERLGSEDTPLVLISDGELAGVPFAALYDSTRGRYLVQDHPLRFAGSLRDAARSGGRPPATASRALLVADPAFDSRSHPGLQRLKGALEEVDSIRVFYPDEEVLAGPAAVRDSIQGALGRARIFHFAGHAVFDDERPDRSYLVVATQRDGSGRLSATDFEGMDLQHVRLVVLSACETLRARGGRSGGFAGFAGVLLAAGTDGVLGSLWRVEDGLTRDLMVEFHHAYTRSDDGPGALRAAQLELLRSPDRAHRSPAAWAGFRYAGN